MNRKASKSIPRLMRIADACRYLGVSRSFIQRLLEQGELPCIRLDGYKIRLVKSDLDTWIRRSRVVYEPAEFPGIGERSYINEPSHTRHPRDADQAVEQ